MAHVFGSSWVVLLLVSVTVVLLQSQAVQGNGWTCWFFSCFRPQQATDNTVSGVPNLEGEVLANCRRLVSGTDSESDRCNTFWNNFKKAFVGKDPKTIKPEAYKGLIESEKIPEKTEVLLWSKTYDMIKWLNEQNFKHYFHLGETIYGSLDVTNAVWCGKKGSQEVQTSGCPDWRTNPVNPVSSYWKSVSAAFAKAATGVVTVLLNGAEEKPFNEKSILATDELINLQKGKVTSLRVILVNKDSSPKNCDDESLQRLRSALKVPSECRTATESELKATEPQKWWQTAQPSHNANG